MKEQGVLTDKTVWENYYKGKGTLRKVNNFINRKFFDAEIIDMMCQHIDDSEQKDIIEMGCGGSEWLPYLAGKFNFSKINGIDYLEVGCKSSEHLLAINNVKNYSIYCADFFEFYKTHTTKYDYIVSFGVVEHFEPPSKVIKVFGDYLKDSGVLITTCPNTGGWSMSMQKYFDKQVYDNHLKFNLNDLIRYHEESGYEILHASYTGFLSFNNLVFSNFSLSGRLAKIGLKFLNAPIVLFFYLIKKYLKINMQSRRLSSNMIIIAKKK